MRTLLVATHNLNKLREFRELFKEHKVDVELLSLQQFPHYAPPPETGSTFQENALIKAKDAALKLNLWSLADDSGLVVPAIGGKPGVHSARWAGETATSQDLRKKLLQEMSSLKGFERSAYFECALSLVSIDGRHFNTTGIVEGTILEKEKGGNGFGYDPLFLKHDYDKTFGELEAHTKNRISHRFKAFEKMKLLLERQGF